MVTTDRVEVTNVDDIEHTVEPPDEGSWAIVEVSTVISPSHFYVGFPFGPYDIHSLMRDDASQGVSDGNAFFHICPEMKRSICWTSRELTCGEIPLYSCCRYLDMTPVAN